MGFTVDHELGVRLIYIQLAKKVSVVITKHERVANMGIEDQVLTKENRRERRSVWMGSTFRVWPLNLLQISYDSYCCFSIFCWIASCSPLSEKMKTNKKAKNPTCGIYGSSIIRFQLLTTPNYQWCLERTQRISLSTCFALFYSPLFFSFIQFLSFSCGSFSFLLFLLTQSYLYHFIYFSES